MDPEAVKSYKPRFLQYLESPEGQEETRRLQKENVENFLNKVRKASSVEEALLFAPGTEPRLLSRLGTPEEQKQDKENAQAIKEYWRPVLAAIREAQTDEEAISAFDQAKEELKEEVRQVRPLQYLRDKS